MTNNATVPVVEINVLELLENKEVSLVFSRSSDEAVVEIIGSAVSLMLKFS